MSTKSYLEYQRTAQLADKLSDEYLLFWMEHKNLTSCTNCESITNCDKMQRSLLELKEDDKKDNKELEEQQLREPPNVRKAKKKKRKKNKPPPPPSPPPQKQKTCAITKCTENLMNDKDVLVDLCEYLDFRCHLGGSTEDEFTNLCENLSRPGLIKMSLTERLAEINLIKDIGYPEKEKKFKKSEVVVMKSNGEMWSMRLKEDVSEETKTKRNKEIDEALTQMKEKTVASMVAKGFNKQEADKIYIKIRRFILLRFYLTIFPDITTVEEMKFCIKISSKFNNEFHEEIVTSKSTQAKRRHYELIRKFTK